MLAEEYLNLVIQQSQQAKKLIEEGKELEAIKFIDEAEYRLEAAKWSNLNVVFDKHGKLG
jgi:ribosome biogenesis SPOUT family RNA methylase Rps3